MPKGKEFVNFHSARQADPDDFASIKMLAELSNGIQLYGGPLKSNPSGSSKTQTIRFPESKFTVEQARTWLKDHDKKAANLLKATGEKRKDGYDFEHEVWIKYENEYEQFEEHFAEEKGKWKGIYRKFGIKDGKLELVKVSFSTAMFTEDGVRQWLKDNNLEPLIFEAGKPRQDSGNEMVMRFDRSRLPTSRMTKEGYLRADAIVTRIGVFVYSNQDGSPRRELRLPEEVFNQDSLDSMKMIPITNAHPQGRFVDATNAKELQIGTTGENNSHDDRFVTTPLVINRKDGVEAIKRGRRELSLGYNAQVEKTDGIWNGERYDGIQRHIRYNHLAIVDEARAGAAAALHLDEADVNLSNHNQRGGRMPILNLNGIQYEAAQEIINDHTNLQKNVADLTVKLDTATTDLEKSKAKVDEGEAKIKDLEKKGDSAAVQALVKSRIDLERKAAKVLDEKEMEKIDGMTDKEIMIAVIAKKHDGIKLDDKSDDYIGARFDSVLEGITEDGGTTGKASGTNPQKKQMQDGSPADNKIDQIKSRNDMIDRQKDAWKNDGKKKEE